MKSASGENSGFKMPSNTSKSSKPFLSIIFCQISFLNVKFEVFQKLSGYLTRISTSNAIFSTTSFASISCKARATSKLSKTCSASARVSVGKELSRFFQENISSKTFFSSSNCLFISSSLFRRLFLLSINIIWGFRSTSCL